MTLEELKKIAANEIREKDNLFDWFGGKIDDAYSGGFQDGRTALAQQILEWLEKNEQKNN